MRPSRADPGPDGERLLSYDVRFWDIRVRAGKRRTRYAVRWIVAGHEFHKSFTTKAHAESRLSELRTAARKGEAFDVETGLPISEARQRNDRSWYEHSSQYVERRWPRIGGGQRRSIADTVATATPAMLITDRGQPAAKLLRRTMYRWVGNMTERRGGLPPEDIAETMSWLEHNTRGMSTLADQRILDAVLDLLAVRLDGKPAAPNTVSRRRSILHNMIGYAVDDGLLDVNPLTRSQWTAPEAVQTVDPDVVINHDQARLLLAAVGRQGEMGQRLVTFFGCMYYSALRPSETVPLTDTAMQLPPAGWGEFRLRESTPLSGARWSDTGRSRDRRPLKHRPRGDVRVVPVPPPLTGLLRHHLREFGTTPDGRLFPAVRGGLLGDKLYGDFWRTARQVAFTPAEAASPLARRPYDLRHAAVSTWLNAGVDPTLVAAWAGHSVQVLLQVYAKCIVGRDEVARRRIEAALGLES